VTRDLPDELQTLVRIDQAAAAIKEIVDLPDPKLSLLLTLLLQNRGRLSGRKRTSSFGELTDAEVVEIERAFAEAFPKLKPTSSAS